MKSLGRTALPGAAWVVAGLCLAGCDGPPTAGGPPAEPRPAEPRSIPIEVEYGETVEQTLAGGECHLLELELEADRYVELSLMQRGVDLFTTLVPPGGGDGIFFDSPTSSTGLELAAFVTERSGPHRLEICTFFADAAPAPYDLRVASPVPTSEADRTTARGFRRYADAEGHAEAGEPAAAVGAFEEARRDFERAGAARPRAWTLFRLGTLEENRHRLEVAEAHFAAAAAIYGELGDPRQEASALSHAGVALNERGEIERSKEVHRLALEAAERAGDPKTLLSTLLNLALAHDQLGQTLEALELHARRRSLARELGDTAAEVDALWLTGKIYRQSGDDRQAQRIFEDALAFARRHGLVDEVTALLVDLGRVHLDREEASPALAYFLEALERKEASEPDRELVAILNNVGRAYRRLGERAKAIDSFRRAVAAIPDDAWQAPVLEGLVLINLASLHNLEGNHEAAAEPSQRALEILRAAGRPIYTTGALKCLADVAVARGDLHRAESYFEEILEIVETLRSRSALRGLRAHFVEDSYLYYEAYVDLLFRLDAREPGSGHAARAFEVAERARARVLLDDLAGGGARLDATAGAEHLARREEIERQMSELERRLFEQRTGESSDAVVRALQARLRDLEAEHALTMARIFAASPGWSALLQSEPSRLDEIQRELVADGDTQLLSFFLGAERSFAWILGPDSLRVEILPPRERIERLARNAARHFDRSAQSHLKLQGRLVAAELSAEVLAPLMPHLTARKLVLVKDGALHYVPFGALPMPDDGQDSELLIDRFELVDLPSASAAVALRQRHAPEARAGGAELAILADPVFQADDERLGRTRPYRSVSGSGDSPGEALSRAAGALGLGGLERLAGSLEEAQRISRLVPPDRRMVAVGFDANRALLLSDRLGGYRILHLAGHGLAHPDLTGLVLSLYDAEGRPVDGLIRPYELSGMNLSAELVVLSACSTGLGDEIRGEGLLGLSRGFLYAGAANVLASLWDVDDRATAALMERFYRALLEDGDPPARALRRAQLSLRRDPAWAAPHYWAGFVLQGAGT